MAPQIPKRLRAIVDLAVEAGWDYDTTKEGHPRLTPPKGLMDEGRGKPAFPVTFSSTPGDSQRGDANQIALLRRLGVKIPSKNHVPKKGNR